MVRACTLALSHGLSMQVPTRSTPSPKKALLPMRHNTWTSLMPRLVISSNLWTLETSWAKRSAVVVVWAALRYFKIVGDLTVHFEHDDSLMRKRVNCLANDEHVCVVFHAHI
mmetsp:Transcript_27134/g.45832  ORF Transcript_27134/g.45832 Transcript_27134/m.45832 type:complete len:112 (-) Transcript_27134:44-379(-)